MAQINIKQIRGASQGSLLFLGTNSVVSENYSNLRWEQPSNKLVVDGSFQYIDGNQQSGYILTSDASGNATWQITQVPTQSISEITISGTQNGTNRDFVLSNLPVTPVGLLYYNGQLLTNSVDYVISGTALTIDSDRPAPTSSDYLTFYGILGGLSGITSINGLTTTAQTFTTYTDSNLTYSINSSGSNHEFNIKLSNDVIVPGTFSVGSVYGDLIPTFDSQYDLGKTYSQWRSLHVASGSVYIGGVTISSNNDAIAINKINLGTEENPTILTASGSNFFINGSQFSSSSDANTLVVAKEGAEFTSIKTAIESITDATASNVYTVRVKSGVYYEESFTIPSYVAIRGESSISTIIQATFSNQTLIYLSDQSGVFDVQIQGCTDTGVAAVVYSSTTTPQTNAIAYVENVRFGSNYTHAKVIGTASGNCIMQCSNVKYGGYPFTIGFQATNEGSGIGRMQLRNVTSTNGGITTTSGLIFAKADASGCGFIVNGCLLTKSVGVAAGIGFQVENGGFLRLTGVNFQRWSKAIYAPEDSGTPSIDAIALNFENNTIDVQIDNTKATGKIQGTDNYSKTTISSTASIYVVNKDQRIITVAKKGGDFSSIATAVNSITDSSDSNRYTIEVGPGIFRENLIDLSTKPYVSIVGSNIQTCQIFATSSSQNLIKMGVFNEISFLSLNDVGSGFSAVLAENSGDFSQIHKVSFYNCDTGIKINASSQETIFYGEYVDFNGTYSKAVDIQTTNGQRAFANIENFYCFPGVTGSYATYVTGTSSELNISVATFEGLGDDFAFYLENGGKLNVSSTDVIGFGTGLWVPNVGTGSFFDFGNVTFADDVVTTINVQQPNTRGFFQGSLYDHTTIQSASEDIYWQFLDRIDGELNITRKISLTYADLTTTDASTLLFETAAMGVIEGGVISIVSGLTVSVSSGYGYLENTVGGVHKRIDWSTSELNLLDNSSDYIYINENSILSYSTGLPATSNNIILGRVVTFNGSVLFIDNTRFDTKHANNKLNLFNRKALGSVYESGSVVTEGGSYSLNITSGSYWFGDKNFQPSGGSTVSFYQVYRDGIGGWIIGYTDSVTSQYDNNSGSLITMSASYYTKHSLYVVGEGVDERYLLVIGQTQYQNLVDVEAASLPTPPSYLEDGVTTIATVYVRQGNSNILQVEDIRPVIGFKSSGVNASSDHGNLLGLSDDDHTQYLLVSGSRPMSGNLQMGSNSITGVDLVNGVNITSHSSRHLPNGLDPLTTGVPSNIGTSNQEGIQNAFARQDHVHALGNDVVSDSNIQAHTSSKITILNKSQLNSSIAYIDQSNTFGTFSQVFKSANLSLTNPDNTFNYTFVGSDISANRNATLPLLTGNDTFVFENHVQTLTNKTLTNPVINSPTISNPIVTGVATFSTIIASGSTSTDLVRITQTGTGNAFVVEDSTSPDSSPFVIDQLGNVGIGTTSPIDAIEVVGYSKFLQINGVTSTNRSAWIGSGSDGTGNVYLFNGTNTNTVFITGNGNSFFNGGNVGIGITNSSRNLDVTGNTRTVNLESTTFATFSRVSINDAPPSLSSQQLAKLSLNSSNEVIEISPYQKFDLYMNNNTTTTITSTSSWVKFSGIASTSVLSSSSFTYSSSDVILISPTGAGGFETSAIQGTAGFAANGWVVNNGAQTNKWYVGTTGASGSGFGAYISSNNGSANIYTTTAASSTYFYRDVDFPPFASAVNVSFSLRVKGENIGATLYDYVRVYNSTSATPFNAGTIYTGQIGEYGTASVVGWTGTQSYTTQTISFNLSVSSATQSRRIAFGWINDGSGGTQPPASIDRIQISYTPGIHLTYTGSQSTFKTTMSGSFLATAGIANVGVQIAKNDVTTSNPSEASFSISTNYKDAWSVQNTFTLSNGDTVAPYINNKSSNTSITVSDLFLNLIQID